MADIAPQHSPFIPPKEERIWELTAEIYLIAHSNEEDILEMQRRKYVSLSNFSLNFINYKGPRMVNNP